MQHYEGPRGQERKVRAVFSDGQVASFPLGDIDLLPRDVSAGA